MPSEFLKGSVPSTLRNARRRVEGKVDLAHLFRAIVVGEQQASLRNAQQAGRDPPSTTEPSPRPVESGIERSVQILDFREHPNREHNPPVKFGRVVIDFNFLKWHALLFSRSNSRYAAQSLCNTRL